MIRKARISKIRNHITVSTTGHQVQSTYEVKQCCLNMLLSMRGWPLLILFAMTLGGCLGRPQHQLPDRYGGGGSGGSFNNEGGGSGGSFNSGNKHIYCFRYYIEFSYIVLKNYQIQNCRRQRWLQSWRLRRIF